jgi:hypothetical protein
MTIEELREAAIKAAHKMRENSREIHRIMFPHADEQKLWDESTDRANVMARYILAMEATR